MIFEDDNNDLDQPDIQHTPTDYTPSPTVRKQIEKLLSDEKAQRTRTWSHYEKLRRDDPATYWRPKTQVAMHRDAEALGSAFNDVGDIDG